MSVNQTSWSRPTTSILNAGLAVLIFLVISRYISPIKFDLFTANHTDVYRYYVFSKTEFSWSFATEPRPLSMLYIQLIGFAKTFEMFLILLSAPAVIFAIMSYNTFCQIMNLREKVFLGIFFYSFVFSSVYFVQVMQLDFGGMLAGCFAVAAIRSFATATFIQDKTRYLLFGTLCTVISVEFKPNFPIAILTILLFFAVKKKSLKYFIFFGINSFCIVLIYFIDKLNESPFLAVDEESPYFVDFSPIENIELIGYYTVKGLTNPIIIIVLVLTLNLMRLHKFKEILFFTATITATSIPLSLLTNRPWEMYSWYALIPIGLYMVYSLDILFARVSLKGMPRGALPTMIYLLVLYIILFSRFHDSSPQRGWFHYIQGYNQELNSSLFKVTGSNSEKILLSGVTGPYHVLKNTSFSKMIYPNLGEFDVLLRESERPWNAMSGDQDNGVYFEDLNFSEYSKIYVFTTKGTLAGIVRAQDLIGLPSQRAKSILNCSLKQSDLEFRAEFYSRENDPVCAKNF
jgi:hypothetical protein